MRQTLATLPLLLLLAGCGGGPEPVNTCPDEKDEAAKLAYPQARKSDVVDTLHGKKIPDPYRWLEDADSEETKKWVDAENEVTFGFLDKIPARAKLEQRLTKLWNFERFGLPWREGDRWFFQKNDGLQNQSVLYVAASLDATPRVLLDPNGLSSDGTVALTGTSVSKDGKLLAYGIARAGSDWQEWRVRDVETGKDLEDELKWVKFSGASWTKDNKGFFYSRYDEPKPGAELASVNYYQKLYYHAVGTKQQDDVLIYERKDQKEWGFGGGVTEDGRYLVIHVWRGTEPKNLIFVKDLSEKESKIQELLSEWEAEYSLVDNDGPVFFFKTDLDASRGRVVAIDTREPARDKWREVIPQSQDTLQAVSLFGDTLVANYLKDARTVIRLVGLDGKDRGEVKLPGIGSAGGFGGRRGDKESFYSFTGFTDPTTIYRWDTTKNTSTIWKRAKVDFDPDRFETKQVFVTSKDGTKLPMFVSHKKGLALDGTNPTLLYGYGGFNVSLTPSFSVSKLVWMELGGVYAIPNLRGGGEYGEEWHQAGTKKRKQNVFDDFIAAAEWLIANKYTSSSKLAIQGGSNGGLLVGACMTQRPELFGAALPAVGVMDMLRYHKFTIGWAWTSDYGSADDASEFETLLAYSPYHNLKPASYPATMVTTADHDDRVVPAHSFKFAAALQAAQKGTAPVLIRIEKKAGHGAGTPTAKLIKETSDTLGFLVKVLDVKTE